jgi:predicted ATPase with chaperone activity
VVDKQVITIFDPTVHHRVADDESASGGLRREIGHDQRYVACRRPAVITGGELTLDRLDLALNTVSRVYEAPMQMKAAGGVLVIDDFGRHQPPDHSAGKQYRLYGVADRAQIRDAVRCAGGVFNQHRAQEAGR